MGEALQTRRLSNAPGGRTAGRLAARFDLKRFLADERGATAIEYGLLIALLSILLVASYGNLQSTLIAAITNATAKVEAATH